MSLYPTDLSQISRGATAPLELNVTGPNWSGKERRVFEQPFVLIGRHERSCLRLEDAEVSRRHAYLQQLGGRVFCLDLGSRTGIRWGGESRPAGWLLPDRGIQIGPFTLELAMATPAGGGPADEVAEDWDPLQDRVKDSRILPRITVEFGSEVLSQLRMNRALVLMGSAPACRVRLRDPDVSRYHCSLVSTPEGVWMIDLLSSTGTCLNGQSVLWALLKEGDRLQVGPYVLRVWYEDVGTQTPASRLSEIQSEAPMQTAELVLREPQEQGAVEPDELPVPSGNDLAQPLAVPQAEQAATESSGLVPALQAELDLVRERLRDADVFRQQLADSQAECDRLREQVRALEIQVAEAASAQARLGAAKEAQARDLEIVCAERDRWQIEVQTLQTKIASDTVEREEWRQRLQETQDELARSHDQMRGLQAELDQGREHQRDAQILREQLADVRANHDQLCTRLPELEDRATLADRLGAQLRDAETERECLRGKLRDAEPRLAELEAMRAECDRLRELETQVAEAASVQARLGAAEEARARELEIVGAERDRWQSEAQTLQTKIASDSAQREEWRQRLDEAQQQLVEEREAVRALGRRLEQESAALHGVQADLESRNAEHREVSQRLQETQDELARSHDQIRGLQAELEQGREHQRDAQVLREELADVRAKHDQLCTRLPELEDRASLADRLGAQLRDAETERECFRVQLHDAEPRLAELEAMRAECDRLRDVEIQIAETASMQARLRAAEQEAQARELEVVCAERDRWQSEAQTLQTKIASDSIEREQLERLTADLHAAQVERDRLHTEYQASLRSADQAWARVSDVERKLTDANAAHDRAIAEVHTRWESERQALAARLEQELKAHKGTTEAALRDVQVRAEAAIREVQGRTAAEREEWRQRLEGAEAQIVWERGLFQEQGEQSRQQVVVLQAERDRLAARLAQAESSLRAGEDRSRAAALPAAEPENVRQLTVQDQVFAEFRSIQVGQPLGQAARAQGQEKPAEPVRPRVNIESDWPQVGVPPRLSAIEQGVEAAWAEAAAGRERSLKRPNPPDNVGKQLPEVGPESGGKETVEHQSAPATSPPIPADTGDASIPSDTSPGTLTLLEGRPPGEDVQGWRSERQGEADQGLWRKILNFVLRK